MTATGCDRYICNKPNHCTIIVSFTSVRGRRRKVDEALWDNEISKFCSTVQVLPKGHDASKVGKGAGPGGW